MESDEILFDRRGAAGLVVLNRPKALNALTLGMIRALTAKLDEWRDDASLTRVVVTAAGDRAFCAGGDLREVTECGRLGRYDEGLTFFREEYQLNARIKRYPKPYVALIDGIVMGGGVGLSIHGSHRVAGDKFLFAMPEVGIGFFPDVGGTWILSRMPGELGTYCALTGDRLKTADAVGTGLAGLHVASGRLLDLVDRLCEATPVDAILAGFSEQAGAGPIMRRAVAVNRLFAGERVDDILARLDDEAAGGGPDADFAKTTAAVIRTKSPTSLRIALAQVRRGRRLSFEECMRTEFRIVSRVIRGHDFYEGVRAVIVDKDNKPVWRPAELSQVTDAEIDRYFAPLGGGELDLP